MNQVSNDLVLTLNNGIKTVRDGGAPQPVSAITLLVGRTIPPGESIVPVDQLLPTLGAGAPPNPQGTVVQEAGGIRIKTAGWYTVSAVANSPGADVDFEILFTPGFPVAISGSLSLPIPIPANTLIQIRATNNEVVDVSVVVILGAIEETST